MIKYPDEKQLRGKREFILVQSSRLQSLAVVKSQWQELGTGSPSTATVSGDSEKTACLLSFLYSLYSLGPQRGNGAAHCGAPFFLIN